MILDHAASVPFRQQGNEVVGIYEGLSCGQAPPVRGHEIRGPGQRSTRRPHFSAVLSVRA